MKKIETNMYDWKVDIKSFIAHTFRDDYVLDVSAYYINLVVWL